jgi:hypothetical protein
MPFKDYDDNDKCSDCGKLAKDLASGRATCGPCESYVELELAQSSALKHLGGAAVSLWNFDFTGVLVQILWSIQKVTRTGDYGKNGYFTEILNRPRKPRS